MLKYISENIVSIVVAIIVFVVGAAICVDFLRTSSYRAVAEPVANEIELKRIYMERSVRIYYFQHEGARCYYIPHPEGPSIGCVKEEI